MKKLLALVLAMVMTLGLATVGASAKSTTYSDEADIKYNEAVDVMTEIGVLGGDENGFRPKDELKRSEGAKIIAYLMLGKDAAEQMTGGGKFSDVPASHWAAGYIEYLAVEGVVGGIGDNKFDPDGTLTTAQFAKMLLGALGYDANIEGFGGPDWMINVQATAKRVGIFDSNSGAIATSNIKREEAALYAFNMIQKPLVEYENKGSTMSVNGATISFGASKASYVINTGSGDGNYGNISQDRFNANTVAGGVGPLIVEFAEEYYTDLIKNDRGNSIIDDFGRESTKWVYKGKEIGTYAKSDELIYTTAVELGQIYKDLGLTKDTYVSSNTANVQTLTAPNAVNANESWFFIDGVRCNVNGEPVNNATELAAANTRDALKIVKESTTKIGGNGAETYVYYKDDGRVRICVVNWYVGEVVGVYAATSSKAAYIDIAGRGVDLEPTKNTSGDKTTTGFAVNDVVIYTASWKDKQIDESPSIGEVKKAELVEGELNSFVQIGSESTANLFSVGSVTVGGKKYTYSAKIANTPEGTYLRTGIKLEIVLDKYGYAIDVGDYSIQNYAVVVKFGVAGVYGGDPVVNLLMTDGTTTSAVYLDDDYHTVNGAGNITYPGGGTVSLNDIVTYAKTNNGEYRLDLKRSGQSQGATTTEAATMQALITNGAYQLYAPFFGTDANARANGKTVFLFKDSTSNYKVYTGIKDVPTIQILRADTIYFNSYSEKDNAAQVVYVDLSDNTLLRMKSNDTIFVKYPASVNQSVYADGDTYYELPAWVNGEAQTIKLNSNDAINANAGNGITHYAMYDSMTVNSKGIPTVGRALEPVFTSVSLKNKSIGIGGNTFSVSNTIKVFEVKDGDVITSSAAAIPTSDSTKLWYNVDSSNDVNYIYWTRDAVKTYSSSDVAASPYFNDVGAFIAANITKVNPGETMNITAAEVTATTGFTVPANVNLAISGTLKLKALAGATINGTMTVGKLYVDDDTTSGAPSALAPLYTLTNNGSVVIKNNLTVGYDGHVDNYGSLVSYKNDGSSDLILGRSLDSYKTLSLAGTTIVRGFMRILGGEASISSLLVSGDDATETGVVIGGDGKEVTLSITSLTVVNSSTATTPSDEALVKLVKVYSVKGGSVSIGTVTVGSNTTLEVDSTADSLNIESLTGAGTIDNDSTATKVTTSTIAKVGGDVPAVIPTSDVKIIVNMSLYFDSAYASLADTDRVSAWSVDQNSKVRTALNVVKVEDVSEAYTTEADTSYILVTVNGTAKYPDDLLNIIYYGAEPDSENVAYEVYGDTSALKVLVKHTKK